MPPEKNNERFGHVIASGVTLSGASNIVLRALEMASALLLLRWLSLYEYGVYQLTLAAFELFAGFFFSGLASVVVADVAHAAERDKQAAGSLFSAYAFSQVALGILLWLIFFLGAEQLAYLISGGAGYVRLMSFLFLVGPLDNLFKLKLQIFLDFGALAFYKALYVIARIGALVLFFALGNFSASSAVLSLIAAPIVAFLIAVKFSRPASSLMIFVNPRSAGRLLMRLVARHGKWALINDFVGNIGSGIRPFLLKIFVGVEAVAIFSLAQNFTGYIISFFPVRDVLAPVLPRMLENGHDFDLRLKKLVKYSVWGYALLGVLTAVLAPFLIWAILPKYYPALPYIYGFLAIMPLVGVRAVLLPALYAVKRQDLVVEITLMRTLWTVAAGVFFIYLFGTAGAMLEAGLLPLVILTPAWLKIVRRISPRWRFPWRELCALDGYDRALLRKVFLRLKHKYAFLS